MGLKYVFYVYYFPCLLQLMIIYIIKLFAHKYIYLYICMYSTYMLAIASQTAGINWLNFFKETHGRTGAIKNQKFQKSIFFSSKFHGQRWALQLVGYYIFMLLYIICFLGYLNFFHSLIKFPFSIFPISYLKTFLCIFLCLVFFPPILNS